MHFKASVQAFKQIIRLAQLQGNDLTFDLNQRGLLYRQMDGSHVTLLDIQLEPFWFKEYYVDNDTIMTFHIEDLLNILKRAQSGDVLFQWDSDKECKIDLCDNYTKSYEIALPDPIKDRISLPKLTFDANFTIGALTLYGIMKDIEVVSSYIQIDATKEQIKFSNEGNNKRATLTLQYNNQIITDPHIERDCTSAYGTEFLRNALQRLMHISNNISFCYGNRIPCKLSVLRPHIDYWIAPRVVD